MANGKTAAPPQQLAYKVREAAALTSFGYDRLLAYIDSGALKAKRDVDADQRPVGPYRILHRDLIEFLDGLPDA